MVARGQAINGQTSMQHLLALVMEWLPPFDWEKLQEQRKRNEARHKEKMDWHKRGGTRYEQGDFSPDPNDPEPAEEEFFFLGKWLMP